MSAEDFVQTLELPVTIAGCDLVPGPRGNFEIRAHGLLTGTQTTQFDADGDTARIVGITGWIADAEPELPIDQHIAVLQELGFARVILRSGKQYELG